MDRGKDRYNDRHTGVWTDRCTEDRETDRGTDRCTEDRETDRGTDRQTSRWKDRQAGRQTDYLKILKHQSEVVIR
jgi:hypothetical protein